MPPCCKVALSVVINALMASQVLLALQYGSPSPLAQLSSSSYEATCPDLSAIVFRIVQDAASSDSRMPASLLRLHFHDCFVDGCDASVLLDNNHLIKSEKDAVPNKHSLRGFDVIDNIKSAVEDYCPGTVSCADILALAAQAAVSTAGGPSWSVLLGRRDSFTANRNGANTLIPAPSFSLDELESKFSDVGLDVVDFVTLSGAHTFGRARCQAFSNRLYNFGGTGSPDPSMDPYFLASLQDKCPDGGGDASKLNPLDINSPNTFDNYYYIDLLDNKGLLQSDQELYSGGDASIASIVDTYANDQDTFFAYFASSMINLGNISPLTGDDGEIRINCRKVNAA